MVNYPKVLGGPMWTTGSSKQDVIIFLLRYDKYRTQGLLGSHIGGLSLKNQK